MNVGTYDECRDMPPACVIATNAPGICIPFSFRTIWGFASFYNSGLSLLQNAIMSKSTLKKALGRLDAGQLRELVVELYDNRRDAKSYLEYWVNPNPDRAYEEAAEKVVSLYFYSTGKTRKTPPLTQLNELVRDYSVLFCDASKTALLQLHIAETNFKWVGNKYRGFAGTEKRQRVLLAKADSAIENAQAEASLGLRCSRLAENIDAFYADPPEPKRRGWRRWY